MANVLLKLLLLIALRPLAGQPITAGPPKLEAENVFAGEGPSWDPAGWLYFTGRGRISRRDAAGRISTFREAAGGANGTLVDPQGRLIVCEPVARRVTRTERDGSLTVLTDHYQGKRYNSPNDLTIDSRGRIYFSDPRYGDRTGMEMPEAVYRIDAPGQVVRILETEVDRPNGLLVTPDDRYLYVADNNNNKVGGARKLWRFDLLPNGTVRASSGKLIFDWGSARGPDGVKIDRRGRLFVAAGRNQPRPPYETTEKYRGGIFILSPEGKLLEFVPIPQDEVTNCTFGGPDLKTLFITAGGSLWSVPLKESGWRR
ncbi:MAG: SMP-30/gluconolactonase/LRE family protein [Bryobacteraceae bacterium]|nr:SMP-30/gluconolactonase/LRE family protein [Bryobacteraceae bacterium]MDW8377479.1 SMP-30/gluconolactonase/LRE family protein [Bryobacterales bacterium]